MKEIEEVFNDMPDEFTSNSFYYNLSKKLNRNMANIEKNEINRFLHSNCKHINNSRRQWRKNIVEEPIILKIPEAIELLKSTGYKVMRQTVSWEEV